MVVALDDCTRSVTIAPQNAPDRGVAAAFPSTVRSEDPASALSPSVMTVMPSKKRPTPPSIEIVVDMSGASSGSNRVLIVARSTAVMREGLERDPSQLSAEKAFAFVLANIRLTAPRMPQTGQLRASLSMV